MNKQFLIELGCYGVDNMEDIKVFIVPNATNYLVYASNFYFETRDFTMIDYYLGRLVDGIVDEMYYEDEEDEVYFTCYVYHTHIDIEHVNYEILNDMVLNRGIKPIIENDVYESNLCSYFEKFINFINNIHIPANNKPSSMNDNDIEDKLTDDEDELPDLIPLVLDENDNNHDHPQLSLEKIYEDVSEDVIFIEQSDR